MSNGYSFFLQRLDGALEDIEDVYNCKYKQFTGMTYDGDIKNVYAEDYAEQDGNRIHIPVQSGLTHKAFDCKLQLLFPRATCQVDARRFYERYKGVKCEYHDTFRKRYATLVMTKQPNVTQERLYSDSPYQLVEFTFSNIKGRLYDKSQI